MDFEPQPRAEQTSTISFTPSSPLQYSLEAKIGYTALTCIRQDPSIQSVEMTHFSRPWHRRRRRHRRRRCRRRRRRH